MAETAEERETVRAAQRRQYQREYRERLRSAGVPEAPRIDAALSFALTRFAHSASTIDNPLADKILKSILKTALSELETDGFDREACERRLLRRLAQRD